MKNLQQKVSEMPKEIKEIKPLEYQGLNLVETITYNGGTSIMYWM